MTTTIAALAGGLGALARYELAGVVQARTRSTFPMGTSVVNLLGAIALGVLAGLEAEGVVTGTWLRVAGTGFLGAFTTFSTWMVETVEAGREGRAAGLRAAALNVCGMLAAGIAAAGLAYGLSRA